jgi:hypothetical protein
MTTKIDCYLSLGCASEDMLKKNLSESTRLEERETEVNIYRIDDKKAETLGLKGSPTIFIDGIELQPQDTGGFS